MNFRNSPKETSVQQRTETDSLRPKDGNEKLKISIKKKETEIEEFKYDDMCEYRHKNEQKIGRENENSNFDTKNVKSTKGCHLKKIKNTENIFENYECIKAEKIVTETIESTLRHFNFTGMRHKLKENSIQTFKIQVGNDKTMLCNGKKLAQGVYLMEGIIQGKNGYAKVAVVNSNDTPIEIESSAMTAELNDLKEFDQYELHYEEKLKHRDRIKYLRENLPMSHCNENGRKAIDWIITNYSDVFFIEGDMATFTEASQHYIPLKPGTQPIFTPQYKIPQAHREIIDQHIDKLVEDDIVEDSTSRWNSPVLLVPKKENAKGEKQYRLVVDFRRLNEATETQTFPMPDLEEELSKMHGSTIFSTMDLNAAFHQILLAECDKELTSFQTTTRKLQFKRMPFGLKGSPITWQRTINSILSDLLIKNKMAYMDNIISYNRSLQEHLKNLANILQRLRKFNLKLKVEKTKSDPC